MPKHETQIQNSFDKFEVNRFYRFGTI